MSKIKQLLKLQNELDSLLDDLKNELINEITQISYPNGITKVSKNSYSVQLFKTTDSLSASYYNLDKQKKLIISELKILKNINDINIFFEKLINLKKIKDQFIHHDLIPILSEIVNKYLNEN